MLVCEGNKNVSLKTFAEGSLTGPDISQNLIKDCFIIMKQLVLMLV